MSATAGDEIQLARITAPQIMRGGNRRQRCLDPLHQSRILGDVRNRLLVVRDFAQAGGQPVREGGMGEAFGFVHGLAAGLIESDPIIYMQDLTPGADLFAFIV